MATPNGISNRVLVPYQAAPDAATPAPPVAFDLAKDSQELDIYYQWNNSDGKTSKLIATNDPGSIDKKPLGITWDSPVGLAPKTLQTRFSATVNGKALSVTLTANSGAQG